VPFLVRPRVCRTGPREYVVAVYVLETEGADLPRELHFRAVVERTPTRARHEVERMVAELVTDLEKQPGASVQTDAAQWTELLARAK
jgi:hypothetical protein